MIFKLLTIFPDMLRAMLGESILGRAINSGAIQAEVIDIRPFSLNKHKNTDDAPYGGGAGMVMLAQPATDAVRHAMGADFRGKRIYLSPKGAVFTQQKARELAKEEQLILLAGHYEGLDQRVIDECIDEEISVGDYVLTGGELGALIITDAVARLLPGVLGSDESSVDESFSEGLLEYPQYTRPREYLGRRVPEVLLGGDQKLIDRWRRDEAVRLTLGRRPELLEGARLDAADRALIRRIKRENSVSVQLICKDADKLARAKANLYELCGGAMDFDRGDTALVLDRDAEMPEEYKRVFLPRLPEEGEHEAAKALGTELVGCAPLAFDPAFLGLCGDEGIKQLVFSGVNADEFACLAARALPVKRVDEKAVHYGKSRRALLAPGKRPRCEALFSDGKRQFIDLCAEPPAYFRALLNYAKTAAPPLKSKELDAAMVIARVYKTKRRAE